MKAVLRIVLLILMGTTVVSAQPGWAQQYSLRAIATLGTRSSVAFGINNQFEIVGETSLPLGPASHAFLWTRTGGTIDLAPGGALSSARAVNDGGQVVGCASFPGVSLHAFLWTQANGVQDLGTLGGAFSCAEAINTAGQVVGIASTATSGNHAFLWTPEAGMQDLGSFGGNSLAFGINDKGQIVGLSEDTAGGPTSAFLWSPVLGMRKLLSPVGTRTIEAHAINNLGQIVGQVTYDNVHGGMQHAVLWPHLLKGGVQDLGTLPGTTTSTAYAINASGVVTGSANIKGAFTWTPTGGMQSLNELVPGNTRWLIAEGRGINGIGKIAANALDLGINGDPERAVVLTPLATTTSERTH